MLELKGKDIYHIRGDTGVLDLVLTFPEDTAHDQVEAVLSVKKSRDDEEYAFQIPCTKIEEDEDGTVRGQFIFTHACTKDLVPGNYLFDVEVRSGSSYATIGPHSYHLLADITR